MIDYALAKVEGPKLKAALTRAQKKGYYAVLVACKNAVTRWALWGAWPDNWSNWQRALDDAAHKQNLMVSSRERQAAYIQPARLEEL
jgi:hypothetical protein